MFDNSDANCLGVDTELFFDDAEIARHDQFMLNKLCLACPIRPECFDYAIHNSVVGFWAGTTTKERKEIRRRLNITPIGIEDTYKDFIAHNVRGKKRNRDKETA